MPTTLLRGQPLLVLAASAWPDDEAYVSNQPGLSLPRGARPRRGVRVRLHRGVAEAPRRVGRAVPTARPSPSPVVPYKGTRRCNERSARPAARNTPLPNAPRVTAPSARTSASTSAGGTRVDDPRGAGAGPPDPHRGRGRARRRGDHARVRDRPALVPPADRGGEPALGEPEPRDRRRRRAPSRSSEATASSSRTPTSMARWPSGAMHSAAFRS